MDLVDYISYDDYYFTLSAHSDVGGLLGQVQILHKDVWVFLFTNHEPISPFSNRLDVLVLVDLAHLFGESLTHQYTILVLTAHPKSVAGRKQVLLV